MLDPYFQELLIKITRPYWQQRMGHAFLLLGESEVNRTFVRVLEQFLLCSAPLKEGPCRQCRSCQLFQQNVHPDYCTLGGDEEAIGIDDIRELHTFLQKTSHQGGYKIITLHEVDSLSVVVANALLKNLEEPCDRTVFLLVARCAQTILPTIRSRCISFYLSSPSVIGKKQSDEDYKQFKEALFWADFNLFNQDAISQKMHAKTKETLYLFYYWIAEYCRYGLTRKTVYLSTLDEKERVDKLLEVVSVEKAMEFLDKITESIESLNVAGINKGLLWGALFHQWRQLCMPYHKE